MSERVTALLEADLRGRRPSSRERMQRFRALAKDLGEIDEVIAMLLDDYYHKSLHEPQYPTAADVAPEKTEAPKRDKPRRGGRGGRRRRRRS